MSDRKKLSDILANGVPDWVNGSWENIHAAPEFGPVPAGAYIAHLTDKQGHIAKTGKKSVKLTFTILEGEFIGRRQWYDIWLSPNNQHNAIRDFAKLGIQSKEQIDAPLPTDKRIRCKLDVKLKRNNDGEQFNEVKVFTVIGVDPVETDPFAPKGGPSQ